MTDERDFAHRLATSLGLCRHHAGIVATRSKARGIAAPHLKRKALAKLAEHFAGQCCEWRATHDDSIPIPRERPTT